MTQYSGVRGGNSDDERVVRSNGTLLMRNDRNIVVVCARSLCIVAFANTSKEARIRSIIVCWISPYTCELCLSDSAVSPT